MNDQTTFYPFSWHATDVRNLLPPKWQTMLIGIANQFSVDKSLIPASVTSRESPGISKVTVTTVGGTILSREAAWLNDLYRNEFRRLAERFFGCHVSCARDERIGINLNIQRGSTQRYEAHVDSNPIEGLLYVTDHAPGEGGELVVANGSDAIGIEQIEAECSRIYPTAGHLIFFDAREHPHFVSPLNSDTAIRIVVAMNFFTNYCSEADRPPDLNEHLFGSE